jgi:hypothetical protein
MLSNVPAQAVQWVICSCLTFVIPYVQDAFVAILIASQGGQYAVFDGVNLLNGDAP